MERSTYVRAESVTLDWTVARPQGTCPGWEVQWVVRPGKVWWAVPHPAGISLCRASSPPAATAPCTSPSPPPLSVPLPELHIPSS